LASISHPVILDVIALGVDRVAEATNTFQWFEQWMLPRTRKTGSERITEKTDSKTAHATMRLSLDLRTEIQMMNRGER